MVFTKVGIFWDYPFFRRPIKRVIRKEVGLFKPTFIARFPVLVLWWRYHTLWRTRLWWKKFSNFATQNHGSM